MWSFWQTFSASSGPAKYILKIKKIIYPSVLLCIFFKRHILLSISVQLQKSRCQLHCNRPPSETSASWTVLVTDAAGTNIRANHPSVDQITNMSFSGCSIWNCGQPVTSTPRLIGYIKASAFNILWIPHSLWRSLYSVSYLPYKKLFSSQSNKGTAGGQKSPVTTLFVLVIQITWWSWGYVPPVWHLRRWSISDQRSPSWCSSGLLWEQKFGKHNITQQERWKMTFPRLIYIQKNT